MKTDDQTFAARYAAKCLNTEDIVNYANAKLNEGVYSEHLVNIIDQSPQYWEAVCPHLQSALKEFGVQIPEFEVAIVKLIRHHLVIITTGHVNPFEEFSLLLRDINEFDLHENIHHYVGDAVGIHVLYGLYYSVDDLNPKNYEAEKTKVSNEMVEESKKWLDKYSVQKR